MAGKKKSLMQICCGDRSIRAGLVVVVHLYPRDADYDKKFIYG